MPYKDPKDRDHKKEYRDFLANGGRKIQSERQRARRLIDKKFGEDFREGKAVDHIKMIKDGGKSTSSNLRVVDFSKNSSRNGKSPAKKKK